MYMFKNLGSIKNYRMPHTQKKEIQKLKNISFNNLVVQYNKN